MGSDVSRPTQNQNNYRGSRYAATTKKTTTPRRMSMGAPPRPPAIRVGGSTGFLDVDSIVLEESAITPSNSHRLSLSIEQIQSQRSRSGSASSQSISSNKKKSTLSPKNRQIIQSCFNNPHENIGARILKRSAEKRKDFGRFYGTQGQEQRDQIADTIKVLLKKSVANIDSADEDLHALATEFGHRFVEFRLFGFKADYFSALADATITECVLLDAAVHPAKVTLNAFSQFITMLFSSVRDGFYSEMRRLRRASHSFTTPLNASSAKRLSVVALNGTIQANQRSPSVSPSSSPRREKNNHSSREEISNSNDENRKGPNGVICDLSKTKKKYDVPSEFVCYRNRNAKISFPNEGGKLVVG